MIEALIIKNNKKQLRQFSSFKIMVNWCLKYGWEVIDYEMLI